MPGISDPGRYSARFRSVYCHIQNISGVNVQCHKTLKSYRGASESVAENGFAILEVCDNGIGIRNRTSKPDSFGLLGMHERVYTWNGEVNINCNEHGGTTIKVNIPLT